MGRRGRKEYAGPCAHLGIHLGGILKMSLVEKIASARLGRLGWGQKWSLHVICVLTPS